MVKMRKQSVKKAKKLILKNRGILRKAFEAL